MTPRNAIKKFRKSIQQSGMPIARLTPATGVWLMLDFYRNMRARKCLPLDQNGDMLLFQWGTYDWGEGANFEFNITRQFIAEEVSDEESVEVISQLSFTFRYPPSVQLDALKEGHRWCETPSDLATFEEFIVSTEAYRAVASSISMNVILAYCDNVC